MLDLDKYIYANEEVRILGEKIHVRQPSIGMWMEINAIEADLNRENLYEKRLEVAKKLLDNNTEGRAFSLDELKALPRSAVETLVLHISQNKAKADGDPN